MRPKIICHMVSSIDGRLLPDRWTEPAPGFNRGLMHAHYEETAVRLGADGWMIGRVSMEGYAKGSFRSIAPNRPIPRETFKGARKDRALAVALDPGGKLHYGRDDAGGDHIVAVLGEGVPDGYLAELRDDGVSYLFAGPDGHDLGKAMETLGDAFDVKTILLEGGGRINGAFLKAGLIDEISLIVYPGIDGLSGIPAIFDYAGTPEERPAAGLSLRHLATEMLEGGMVWLRYAVGETAPI